MRQAIHQHRIVTYMISLGLITACVSLLQPIPFASAQQLTGTVGQGTIATVTQKKDAQTLSLKPHRLIRKPQNAPIASVEPSPSGSSPVSSIPAHPPSQASDNVTSQPTEPSSLNRSLGESVPLATMSVAPSPATVTGSIAGGAKQTGTTPLAAAGASTASASGNRSAGGRSMSKLAAEMPGLAQLITPPSAPSAPVVPVNPGIGASPTSLSFTAQQGSGNPTAQTLSISNTGGGTLSWSASNSTTWLSLSSASGTGAGTVIVNVTTGTLTAGSYSGSVVLNATGASSVLVPVTFTVTAAPVPPAIGASPTNLSFTATQGGANPATQTLSISNTGGGTLSWTASETTPWLTVSPASGTGNGTVTLSAVTGSLTVGSHAGAVTLSGGTGVTSVTVPVTFTVTAAPVPPAIGASPTNLSFTATQGGANPATQTLSISNTGGGTLSWTASETTPWLTVSPASGTGNGTVTLSAVTGSLTVGSHAGAVTLSGGTGVTSVTVPVTFTVTAAPVPPAIGASPTNLSFTATQGGANPATQTLSISNTGGGTLSWTASETTPWLTVSPASGTGNGTVTLSAVTGTLTPATYSGTVTLSGGTGVTSVTVPVSFIITAALVPPAIGASPTSFSFAATQGAANPTSQLLNISNPGGGTLTWSITDNQTWLTLNATSGTTTTETDSVTLSVNTNGLQAATHSATITITATGASNTPQTIPVTLTLSAPATSSATLTWNPNTEPDLASYRVYRSTQQGVYGAAIATVPAGTVSYTAIELPVGQTYYFTITAVDSSNNESPSSNEVNKPIP